MRNLVYIEKDDLNGIAIARDGYRAVMVQVVRFVDQLRPSGPGQEMEKIKTTQVIHQIQVPVINEAMDPIEHLPNKLNEALSQAREFLKKIRAADGVINQVLSESLKGNEEINESDS